MKKFQRIQISHRGLVAIGNLAIADCSSIFCLLIFFAAVLLPNASIAQANPFDNLEPADNAAASSLAQALEGGASLSSSETATPDEKVTYGQQYVDLADKYLDGYLRGHTPEQALALLEKLRAHSHWRGQGGGCTRGYDGKYAPMVYVVAAYTDKYCDNRSARIRQMQKPATQSQTPPTARRNYSAPSQYGALPGQGVQGAIVPGQGAGGGVVPGQGVAGGIIPGQGVSTGVSPSVSPAPPTPMFNLTELSKTFDQPVPNKKNGYSGNFVANQRNSALADAMFDPKPLAQPKNASSNAKHSIADELFGDTTAQKGATSNDKASTGSKGGWRESEGWASDIGQDADTEIHGTFIARLIKVNGIASELEVINHDTKHSIYISGNGTGSNQYNNGNGRTGQEVAPGATMRFPLGIYQSKDHPLNRVNFTCQYWHD